MSRLDPVAVSAPGKVLFAGGFLVLDRAHTGLVFGLNARIHARVESWQPDIPSNTTTRLVVVSSPQFLDSRWLYEVSDTSENSEDVAVHVQQISDQGSLGYTTTPNKFVETTLRYVLTYLSHTCKDSRRRQENVKVTVLADDDYYSKSEAQSQQSTELPTSKPSSADSGFTRFGVKLSDAHKTGLGSSAALVTSLVTGLLAFYTASGQPELNLAVIHNLAQAAHCAAQGKVGSGFDVAAAVYGSCLYRRFSPAILEGVGEATSPGFGERLHRCVDDLELEAKWDVEVASQAVQIPETLLLVMCDVDCGSETPGMVRKVLQWRKDNPETSALLWGSLQQGQESLCRELRRLAEAGVGESVDDFTALRDEISTIRSLVREMSEQSRVPIEPPVITELLDFCSSLPGVTGGVAPGAGGYDAVALLVENDGQAVQELQTRLEGWKSKDSTGASIGHVRLLGVKQEKEGVRMDEVSKYDGWT